MDGEAADAQDRGSTELASPRRFIVDRPGVARVDLAVGYLCCREAPTNSLGMCLSVPAGISGIASTGCPRTILSRATISGPSTRAFRASTSPTGQRAVDAALAHQPGRCAPSGWCSWRAIRATWRRPAYFHHTKRSGPRTRRRLGMPVDLEAMSVADFMMSRRFGARPIALYNQPLGAPGREPAARPRFALRDDAPTAP